MHSKEWQENSYLAGGNAPYVEDLYEAFLVDPDSVSPEWSAFFRGVTAGGAEQSHQTIRLALKAQAQSPRQFAVAAPVSDHQAQVDQLIGDFRRYGHYSAHTNPIEYTSPETHPHLTLAYHGLTDASLSETFDSRGVLPGNATLSEIVDRLKTIYVNTTGYEFFHIDNDDEREWLQSQIETVLPNDTLTPDAQKLLLSRLTVSDTLEKYLDTRYVGQKRFSIEGCDALIPMLRTLSEVGAERGVQEIVIGMAHRGRLNVLLNVMGRASDELFKEFDGALDYGLTSGDVKYHRGFSSDVVTPTGTIHLSLMFNPSHLEFINPVAMGSVRARQDLHRDEGKHDYALTVQIHGDAAFAGQGVVMESLSMSKTRAYDVGGSLHIILNNQVGFTTSDRRDSRSSHYCSDLAKMIAAPIFHVNGDDPESALRILKLAFDYRMRYHKDVVIDLHCYRRHGHQEVDEPNATQPLMYQIIKGHPVPAAIYAKTLQAQGVIVESDYTAMIERCKKAFDAGEALLETVPDGLAAKKGEHWKKHHDRQWQEPVESGVTEALLRTLGERLTTLPDDVTLYRNIEKIVEARRKMTAGEQPIDWGFAETLAYATLLHDGIDVRLTGEDCRRGTFFHRHASLADQKTGNRVMPLLSVANHGALLQIYDSLLSEVATVGFEYGYSTADPKALVMWEAQFGDFANVAQVIVDQFISSGWQKWNRLSGFVMLLPHGYEGMGPEHSSARLERYLQLCAQENIQVCIPTTPAQMFHLLRRQALRHYRRPLIIMTPKSFLRHKLATSTLTELATGHFQPLIPEIDSIAPERVKRLILCSGKVYYELLQKRRDEQREDVAILRIEQLYPFPYEAVAAAMARYPNVTHFVWAQEEPKNQGAWFWMRDRLVKFLSPGAILAYAGRMASAAPAAGYPALHKKEQLALIEQAIVAPFPEKLMIRVAAV